MSISFYIFQCKNCTLGIEGDCGESAGLSFITVTSNNSGYVPWLPAVHRRLYGHKIVAKFDKGKVIATQNLV